jgi:hypothetical protein
MADLFWDVAHSLWFGGKVRSSHPYTCPALYVGDVCSADDAVFVDGSALPPVAPGHVRIVCVSDTHECHWRVPVPPGDMLIHAGDILLCNRRFSAKATEQKLADFNKWLGEQPHTHKVVIGGNHDVGLEVLGKAGARAALSNAVYLEDETVSLCGLTIHGAPFSQGKSHNRAFQPPRGCRDAPTLAAIPPCDVLITHQAATTAAITKAAQRSRLHVAGHFHDMYGVESADGGRRVAVVCSSLDGKYRPANPAVVVDLPLTPP